MKRPASPALSISPNWTWISFPWKSGFLSFVGSDFLQLGILRGLLTGPAGFNEKSKDQMLQAVLQSSQPGPYLDVWEEFYVQLQIRRFPACVMSPSKLATPITAEIQYRSPIKVKFYIFLGVLSGFYDNSREVWSFSFLSLVFIKAQFG